MRWVLREIRRERRDLERARRRFVRKPCADGLHDVRTTGRRLRSLLEDVADLVPRPRLRRQVKAAAEVTDAARDAAVLLALLEKTVDPAEREIAQPLIDALTARVADATKTARRELRQMTFA